VSHFDDAILVVGRIDSVVWHMFWCRLLVRVVAVVGVIANYTPDLPARSQRKHSVGMQRVKPNMILVCHTLQSSPTIHVVTWLKGLEEGECVGLEEGAAGADHVVEAGGDEPKRDVGQDEPVEEFVAAKVEDVVHLRHRNVGGGLLVVPPVVVRMGGVRRLDVVRPLDELVELGDRSVAVEELSESDVLGDLVEIAWCAMRVLGLPLVKRHAAKQPSAMVRWWCAIQEAVVAA